MEQSKRKIRALIFIVLIVLVTLLLLRFILEFANSGETVFGKIMIAITSVASFPFGSIKIGSFEISSIIGIIFFIGLGYILSKIISSLSKPSATEKVPELIETILRIFEFLILLRVILKIIGAEAAGSLFVGIVYFLTNWTQGIIPSLNLLGGTFELSSLIILAILIIIDINTEVIERAVKFIGKGKLPDLSSLIKGGRSKNPSEQLPQSSESEPSSQSQNKNQTSSPQPPSSTSQQQSSQSGSSATWEPAPNSPSSTPQQNATSVVSQTPQPAIPTQQIVINVPLVSQDGQPAIPNMEVVNNSKGKSKGKSTSKVEGKDSRKENEKEKSKNERAEDSIETKESIEILNDSKYPYSNTSIDYNTYYSQPSENNRTQNKKKEEPQEG